MKKFNVLLIVNFLITMLNNFTRLINIKKDFVSFILINLISVNMENFAALLMIIET